MKMGHKAKVAAIAVQKQQHVLEEEEKIPERYLIRRAAMGLSIQLPLDPKEALQIAEDLCLIVTDVMFK